MSISINLDYNVVDFAEFVKDINMHQGLIETKLCNTNNDECSMYLVRKLDCTNNIKYIQAYPVYSLSIKHTDVEYENSPVNFALNKYNNTIISDSWRYSFTVDTTNKIIVILSTNRFITGELNNYFSDYNIIEYYIAKNNIQDIYSSKVEECLNNNFNMLMVYDAEYRDWYNNVCNSPRSKTYVENTLFMDYDKIFTFKDFNETLELKELSNLNTMHEHLANTELVLKKAEDFVKIKDRDSDTYTHFLRLHARVMAYNNMIRGIKSDIPERLKISLEIKKAVENVGKSLVIVNKEGKEIKVNNIRHGYDNTGIFFSSMKGGQLIRLPDIDKIKFNGKVIFEVKSDVRT